MRKAAKVWSKATLIITAFGESPGATEERNGYQIEAKGANMKAPKLTSFYSFLCGLCGTRG